MIFYMCHYMHHSLSKEQDTVGVFAPNSFVASALEPFSLASVSTPCSVNQSRHIRAFCRSMSHTHAAK